jgi:hypothetical protein
LSVSQEVAGGSFSMEVTMDADLVVLGLVAIGIVGIVAGLTAVGGGMLRVRIHWRRFWIELGLRKEAVQKEVTGNRAS